MNRYVHQPLNVCKKHIRLLTLHPEVSDDIIRISISYVPFRLQSRPTPSCMSLIDIRKSLPEGCFVSHTLEGNRLFTYFHPDDPQEEATYSSWTHPDPVFERQHDTIHPPKRHATILDFESLSSVWGSVSDMIDITVKPTAASPTEASLLAVTSNLYQALIHLRKPDQRRVLWIMQSVSTRKTFRKGVCKFGKCILSTNMLAGWYGCLP
jgi:hypothetical protein